MGRSEDRSAKVEELKIFFDWLVKNIEQLFFNEKTQELFAERLALINPYVRWEVGPWDGGKSFFAFSPNLDRNLLAVTEELVAQSPKIENWVFLSAKPRKLWKTRTIKIRNANDELLEYVLDNWAYYLTSFNEGEFFDVNLVPYGDEEKPLLELEHIGSLLVEFELGEREFLDFIDRVNIVMPSDLDFFANKIGNLFHQVQAEKLNGS